MTNGQGNFGKMGCNFNSNGNQLFQTAFMTNGNSYQNSTAATTSGRNTRKSPANTTASKSDERSTVKSSKLTVQGQNEEEAVSTYTNLVPKQLIGSGSFGKCLPEFVKQ